MSDDQVNPNSAIAQASDDGVAASDDSNALANTPAGDEYDVEMWWVKDVKEGDAKQAEVTMRALMSAGLKPRLVASALEKGHGYSIETMETKQRFNNLTEAVGELAVSEEGIGAYEIVEKPLLGPGEHLEQMIQEEGLIRAEVVTDLEQVREQRGEIKEKIEMTVVVRREPPKQLENNTDASSGGFVRLEDLKSSD